jgi:glutathione peroxidase-family protein
MLLIGYPARFFSNLVGLNVDYKYLQGLKKTLQENKFTILGFGSLSFGEGWGEEKYKNHENPNLDYPNSSRSNFIANLVF